MKNGRPCPWKGQPRPNHWKRPGPKKDALATIRTRFAGEITRACIRTRGPVRIDCRRFSGSLGVPAETLRKATMVMRQKAWCFQAKHFLLYLTPSRTAARRGVGKPQLWAVSRHRTNYMHRNARWHWRRRSQGEWNRYIGWIKKLAWAMIYRGRKKSDGKPKGFATATSRSSAASALDPPTANRAAWRRYGRIAGKINRKFSAFPGAPSANIKSWSVNRLREQHRYDHILLTLQHAIDLQLKFNRPHAIAWILAVACRHLNSDGMLPTQRRRLPWRPTDTAGAIAPAFKNMKKIEEQKPELVSFRKADLPEPPVWTLVDEIGRTWYQYNGEFSLINPKEKNGETENKKT